MPIAISYGVAINLIRKGGNNMKNLRGMAVLAGLLMLFAVPAAAVSIADSVAVITDHSGNARVYTTGAWKNAEINMPLYEGDSVKTSAESALEVTFDDATIVKLGDNTELKLTELKREGEKATTIFNLLKGKFMAIVDKLKNPESRFEVHTKMAIAAVKGTELAVEAGDDNTNLGVYTGSVEFTGPRGGSVSGKYKVIVDKGNESGCGGSGVPGKPASIRYMGKFQGEFGNLRETIKVVRELKMQGGDAVYKWRIQKKLQKDGEKIGSSETEGTIGGTNNNIVKVKEKINKALKSRLKKQMSLEKSHAYRDLRFVNEQMKADLHLGKTMTDLHGNRIRVEELVFRPEPDQVDLLSMTMRKGDRIDYLRFSNIFANDIPENPTWKQWNNMWKHEWNLKAPENWLKEQRIKLSNIDDWVFMGTSYYDQLWNNAATTSWKLLNKEEILAVGTGNLYGDADMTMQNFTAVTENNTYVKEQRFYGKQQAATAVLLPSDQYGSQDIIRGRLDKTYDSYNLYATAMAHYGTAPISNTGFINYNQENTVADYANDKKLAIKHTRFYNDGTRLALNLYLINDYGMIQDMPDFRNPLLALWDTANVIFNSNVEIIAKSNVFENQEYGIDVVSKLLWWLVLNPKEVANTSPDNINIIDPIP